jgi:hypothetical protein
MSYPFDQIPSPQERTALAQLTLDDLKAQLRAYAIAAPQPPARTASFDLDDWSGSFDMHLGVYTSD